MDEKQTARFLFIDVRPLKVFWAQTVSELKSFDFQAVLSLFTVYIYIKKGGTYRIDETQKKT